MDIASMTDILIIFFLKPLVLLCLTSLLWFLVRKKSAALQHFVLSLGFVGVLFLPMLAFVAPVIPWEMNAFDDLNQWFSLDVLNRLGVWLGQGLTTQHWLLIGAFYFLPATSLISYLLLGVVGLWRHQRLAREIHDPKLVAQLNILCELVDLSRPVKIFTSVDVKSPYTWGLFRPVIMLPSAARWWEEDKQISVLMHELGHIARWDWLISIVVRIVCALFWFLLPVWWLARQLFLQAEIACDDYIYKLRDKHLTYARNLLAFASPQLGTAVDTTALRMGGQSEIHQRILAVLDRHRSHQPVATESAQYWILIGGLLLVVFSGMQWVPLGEQRKANTGALVVIQSPDASQEKEIADVRNEIFSWELIQSLKPALTEAPLAVDLLEHLHVQAVQPDESELQDLSRIELGGHHRPFTPRIQVEGFLPLKLVTPEYPAQALSKGIEGWVQVEFTIDVDGHITNPQVIARSPSAIFDRSVLSALKKSHYRPQLLDGQPIVVHGVTEIFRFTLVDNNPRPQLDRDDLAQRRR